MDRYNIEILGLSEIRWNTSGITTISTDHTIIYSGNPNKDDPHEKGVGFLLNKITKKSLLEWNSISPRIVTARFDTKFQKTTVIQVYASTNEAQEIEKEDFYNALQYALEFQISLQNRFSALPILDNVDQNINSIWEKIDSHY
jgi:exonuclease III